MMIKEYERIQRGFYRQLNNKNLSIKHSILWRVKCDMENFMRNNDFSSIRDDVLELKCLIDKEIELTETKMRLIKAGIL